MQRSDGARPGAEAAPALEATRLHGADCPLVLRDQGSFPFTPATPATGSGRARARSRQGADVLQQHLHGSCLAFCLRLRPAPRVWTLRASLGAVEPPFLQCPKKPARSTSTGRQRSFRRLRCNCHLAPCRSVGSTGAGRKLLGPALAVRQDAAVRALPRCPSLPTLAASHVPTVPAAQTDGSYRCPPPRDHSSATRAKTV